MSLRSQCIDHGQHQHRRRVQSCRENVFPEQSYEVAGGRAVLHFQRRE